MANLYLILVLGVYQMMSRTEISALLLTSLDMSEGREFLRPIWWIVLPSDYGNENTILYTNSFTKPKFYNAQRALKWTNENVATEV